MLTLVAGCLLASAIVAIGRGRRLPPDDPRRPRTACLVAATIVAAIAFAVAALAMLADLGAFGRPELPIVSMLCTGLVGGLTAFAIALRLVAVPAAARSPSEEVWLFALGATTLGVTCCYGIFFSPAQSPAAALTAGTLMVGAPLLGLYLTLRARAKESKGTARRPR